MTRSAAEAQNLVRVSKHPKSTKYGRQNPIAEKWNSDEQIVAWRKAWADTTNVHLERAGADARIDHRSHAERGMDEQPTIHEGVIAHVLEKKGIIADRCEINRQIKANYKLLRELRSIYERIAKAVKNTVPAIAEAMESSLQRLKQTEAKYHAELDAALAQSRELTSEAENVDNSELHTQRQTLRETHTKDARDRLQQARGK